MTTSLLRVQHSSLQFSDNRAQQEHDVEALFKSGIAFPVKSFTEASITNPLFEILQTVARDYNHVLHNARGNAVAVDRTIIKPRSVEKGTVYVVSNDRLVGKMHDRVFPTVKFDHINEGIGEVNYASFHYATKGAKKGDPNEWANQIYADKVAEWMKIEGRRAALAFGAGDFNMNDRDLDWAFGANFTSMADELDRHQNTGHGPIDGFVSYDRDGRVKAKTFTVLDDSEMKLFSDHYVCRGVWEIRNLK